jgi:hypothetical protein
MVHDGSSVLNYISSALMNGVCCIPKEIVNERDRDTQDAVDNIMNMEYKRRLLLEQERILKLDTDPTLNSKLKDVRFVSHDISSTDDLDADYDREGSPDEINNPKFCRITAGSENDDRSGEYPARFYLRSRSTVSQSSTYRPIPLLVGTQSGISVASSLFNDEDSDNEYDIIQLM